MMHMLPTLKAVISTIAVSLGPLSAVLGMSLIVLLIYVMLGLVLYMGKLDRACYWKINGTQVSVQACGNSTDARHCELGQVCYEMPDVPAGYEPMVPVFNGTLSFNNAGLGIYTVYIVMTLEGWTEIMYALNDSLGDGFNWIYFVTLIIFSSFVMINIIRGVMSGAYSKHAGLAQRKLKASKKDGGDDGDTVYDEIGDTAGSVSPDAECVQLESATAERGDSATEQTVSRLPRHGIRHQDSVMDVTNPHIITGLFQEPRKRRSSLGVIGPSSADGKAAYNSPAVMRLVKSTSFTAFIVAVILINAVFLGLDKHPQSQAWKNMITVTNFVFVGIYIFEFLLKIVGYGFFGYFRRKLNQLDFLIIATSIAEIIMVESFGFNSVAVLSAFKSFRMLRLFKVMTYSQSFREFVVGFGLAFYASLSFFAVLTLYVVVVALFGKELFGGVFWSRSNFDDFGTAMISSFQMVTVEGVDLYMMEGIQASGGPNSSGAIAGLFFMVTTIIGDLILVSVLLALVVNNLELQRKRPEPHVMTPEDVRNSSFRDGNVEDRSMVPYYSLVWLSPTNVFRRGCHDVMWSSWFNTVILLCIFGSCVTLAIENYQDPTDPINDPLLYFDIIFTAIFGFEMLIKWVALGVAAHPRSYFRSGWNWMDFIIVITSIVAIVMQYVSTQDIGALGALRVLRALRAIRAVRMVEHFGQLKKACRSIVQSLEKIGGIAIIGVVIFYCFAITGTALFKGQMNYCTNPAMDTEAACVSTNYTDSEPGEWKRHYLNYDNVGESMMTLVSMIQKEEWKSVYQNSADVNGVDRGPKQDAFKTGAIFFYVVFIVVVAFFFANVLLAFVTVMYGAQADQEYLRAGLEKMQVRNLRYALTVKLRNDPYAARRGWGLFKVVNTDSFEFVVLLAVFLNTIALMLEHNTQSDGFSDGLMYANLVFLVTYGIEFLLKILTFGVAGYFTDAWNVLDFVVLVLGIFEACFASASFATGFRAVRICRTIKFIHQGRFRTMIAAFWESIKGAAWISLLVVLVFFVYAVVGMQLFARLPLVPGSSITGYNNFRSLTSAFLALFRVCTGENFQQMMDDSHIEAPYCNENDEDGSTCGSALAEIYYISFVLLVGTLLLTLFVAIFVENFEYMVEDVASITPFHLADFVQAWQEMDPAATGLLHHRQLATVLRKIDPPLGLGPKASTNTEDVLLSQLPVGFDGEGKVKFRAAIVALVRARCKMWELLEPEDLRAVMAFIVPSATADALDEACSEADADTVITLRMLYVVRRLQSLFRRGRTTRQLEERFRMLEDRIKALQGAHNLATASRGPDDSAEALAASDMALQNIEKIQREHDHLRRQLTPHLRVADFLVRAQEAHSQLKARRTRDPADGNLDLAAPGFAPLPGATWKPPMVERAVQNAAFSPRSARGSPIPSHDFDEVPLERKRCPQCNISSKLQKVFVDGHCPICLPEPQEHKRLFIFASCGHGICAECAYALSAVAPHGEAVAAANANQDKSASQAAAKMDPWSEPVGGADEKGFDGNPAATQASPADQLTGFDDGGGGTDNFGFGFDVDNAEHGGAAVGSAAEEEPAGNHNFGFEFEI